MQGCPGVLVVDGHMDLMASQGVHGDEVVSMDANLGEGDDKRRHPDGIVFMFQWMLCK